VRSTAVVILLSASILSLRLSLIEDLFALVDGFYENFCEIWDQNVSVLCFSEFQIDVFLWIQ